MNDDDNGALAEMLFDLDGVEVASPPALEWPDAKALCCYYGAVMRNLPAYRQGMAAADIITLAYEFAVMDYLVALFGASADAVSKLAGPAMAQLRDICTAEGIRRGVMLAAGDDVSAISLAVELRDELVAAFTPGWALGLQT